MGKNSIWVTKKQLRNRIIFFAVSIVAILIILAIVFSNVKHDTKTQEEPAPVVEEQQQEEQVEPETEEETLEPEEEPLEADCAMKIKHAEDELLDAYKIQKEAKDEVRRLEEQIAKANQKIDESNVFVEMAQEVLNEAKECSE
ncbi:hypothetical protein KY326_03990 [Candidatus Woesearchaeota archaeon]|nr:hypothetical protein [Candidatus Woesearchaeota archaeon]